MSLTHKYKRVPVAIFGAAFAAASWAQTPPGSETLEEIIVTGTRAALAESLERKKAAQLVQDSIVAEDLGRFPDDNVADSLSHITGITLQRTRGGEGQFVNVRGLGPEFSIVTLNGRILATDGDGREFAFDVLPSEIIAGADVYKSANAAQLEGSIGGAINLTSARPLELPGLRTALSVEGDYNDLSEDTGYKASAVFSNTFADDRMGVMVTAVYQDSEVRSDAVQEFSINPDSPGEFDANGDGEISEDETGLLGLCCTSFGARIQQKKRTGVTAVWQWQATDNLTMSIDGMFTRLNAPTVGYHQSYYVEDSILDDAGTHRWSDVTIRDHWVTDMTVAELVPELSTITEHRVVDTTQFGWNAVWQATERLSFNFDAYRSKSDRDSGGKDTWVVSGIAGSHVGHVHMNNNGLPDIGVTLEDGRDYATALESGELGNADFGLHYIGLSGTDVIDKVTGFTVAGEFALDQGMWRSLQFGAAGTERTKIRSTIENDTNGGSCQYCNHYGVTFEQLGADVVHPVSLTHFMRNGGGSHPVRFVSFDVAQYLNALRALDGQPRVDENGDPTGDVYDSSLTAPELNPVQSYDVKEETIALYLQANLGSADQWFANFGVRWLSTDTTAKTAVDAILFVDDPTPQVPTSSPDVTYSPAAPLTQKGSYDKLLPSINVGYWLRKDLLLRAAVAQAIARPSLNQLAPTRTDNTLDRTFAVFYDGNANLKPVEADQADLSLEWYFADKSVLSGAVFWKDIDGFITTELQENIDIGVVGSIGGAPEAPILYDVERPINGDKAKVWGLELGMQHFFANGFGVRANYTLTDTKAYVGGVHVGDLEGVSESQYSVALMFENDRWDAQIAADYSGEYTETIDAVGGLSQKADPITWVTASVAFKVTDSLQVSLEGRNLLDEYYISHLGRNDILAGFETWGRSYLLGATAKF